MRNAKIRCYSELSEISDYLERYKYLRLGGAVGKETFGYDRYLNQVLYRSYQWKKVRDEVIIRDHACDLGIEGYEIYGQIIIHHMNPITEEQILQRDPIIFDPEYLITTVLMTHNAIHYADESLLNLGPIERYQNDTCPWKR